MPETLQGQIATWSADTFKMDTHSVWTKAQAEFDELHDAIYSFVLTPHSDRIRDDVVKEAADVLFMLFQLAEHAGGDLIKETKRKFLVNKARKWELQPDGTYQHIKEEV